jgi:uncharacterized membrane protein/thiol-disulfide isomerase/thioredoxin
MKESAQFRLGLLLGLLAALFPGGPQIASTLAQAPVVRAILFYSPTCPHCHKVITEDLPPLFEKYGDQLQIVGVDISTSGGQAIFVAAIQRYNIPPENQAVPMLFIGEQMLLGSQEIPERLPVLIEQYLAQGGVDWPEVPGLRESLEASQTEDTSTAHKATPTMEPTSAEPNGGTLASETPQAGQIALSSTVTPIPSVAPTPISGPGPAGLALSDPPSGLVERLARDPAGNALAIVVLLGMILSLGGTTPHLFNTAKWARSKKFSWIIPVLCGIGLFVAAYLAYVESAQVRAVCGPVGDCNTVQQSEYARLFGVLPVGMLGLVGYVAIGIAWVVSRFGEGRIFSLASLALSGMTLFGVLFSIYLTFLEPFVIGAACIWCLSSAVIMTLLLWFVVHPVARGSNVDSPGPATSIR